MPEMPERVYLSGFDSYQGWSLAPCDDCPAYVPESRLREVEAELCAALDQVMLFGSDIDRLRAERDAALAMVARLVAADERYGDKPALADLRAKLEDK